MAEESKGIVAEFKEFILRGNVVDLAVAVVIGAAFGAVVNAAREGHLDSVDCCHLREA